MFKLAVCGYPIMVHPKATLYHFSGDYTKRGYSWNYDDHVRNQFIAAYCVGGEPWLQRLLEDRKKIKNSNKSILDKIADSVRSTCKDDFDFINSKKKTSIDDYFAEWRNRIV
jgi:hypothetical protein